MENLGYKKEECRDPGWVESHWHEAANAQMKIDALALERDAASAEAQAILNGEA